MVIIERQIQKVRSGKWTELEELDKKFIAVESGLGFPPQEAMPQSGRWTHHGHAHYRTPMGKFRST